MRFFLIAVTLACVGFDDLLAMGPDPGGRSGARVTAETTKTDRPAVDSARASVSGEQEGRVRRPETTRDGGRAGPQR